MWTLESFPGHEAKTRYEGVVPGDGANDLIRADRPPQEERALSEPRRLAFFFWRKIQTGQGTRQGFASARYARL